MRKGLSALRNAAETLKILKAGGSPFSLMTGKSADILVKEIPIKQKQQISRVRSHCRKCV